MFCLKCGTQLNDGVKFCNVCGTAVMSQNAYPTQQTQPVQPMYQPTQQTQPAQPMYQPTQQTQPAQPMYQPTQQAQPAQPMYQPTHQAQPVQPMYQPTQQNNNLILSFCKKIKTEAIIWYVVAALQVFSGLFYLLLASELEYYLDMEIGTVIIQGLALIAIAVINIINSTKAMSYRKKLLTAPSAIVGIVDKYRPVGGLIFALIYNILFGGVIGVVGIIFGFITRSFVMKNEHAFRGLERTVQPNNQFIQ